MANTIVLLDLSLLRCAWRTFRRSRERLDYWRWMLSWRCRSRPALLRAIALHAPTARLYTLREPGAVARFIADATRDTQSSG
ncbi:MAG TPA: hypothetical protein VGK36_21410 [Candidatus Angelobacter sp.]